MRGAYLAVALPTVVRLQREGAAREKLGRETAKRERGEMQGEDLMRQKPRAAGEGTEVGDAGAGAGTAAEQQAAKVATKSERQYMAVKERQRRSQETKQAGRSFSSLLSDSDSDSENGGTGMKVAAGSNEDGDVGNVNSAYSSYFWSSHLDQLDAMGFVCEGTTDGLRRDISDLETLLDKFNGDLDAVVSMLLASS